MLPSLTGWRWRPTNIGCFSRQANDYFCSRQPTAWLTSAELLHGMHQLPRLQATSCSAKQRKGRQAIRKSWRSAQCHASGRSNAAPSSSAKTDRAAASAKATRRAANSHSSAITTAIQITAKRQTNLPRTGLITTPIESHLVDITQLLFRSGS